MRALVLSGGGSKGAFQVNVLKSLQKDNPDLDYDIYTGVSVGALNAVLLATGPLKDSLPDLEKVWLEDIKGSASVRKHRILKAIMGMTISMIVLGILAFIAFLVSWHKLIVITFILGVLVIGSLLVGFFFFKKISSNRSIYDTAPLRSIVQNRLNIKKLKSSGKLLRVGSVSYQTGEYRTANEQSDNIVDWVMASSAFPIFFPMPEIDGHNWTDGGVKETAPLRDAIELGATQIDVILTFPLDMKKETDTRITYQISRVIGLMANDIMINVIHDEMINKRGIKIRIIAPKKHFKFNPLDFKPKEIREMYNADYEIIESPHESSLSAYVVDYDM